MEEEGPVPPPGRVKNNPYLLTGPSLESQETYVVQVPRDQVYRIPPPENALIVERYTRNSPNKDENICWCSGPFGWIISTIALLAIVVVVSFMIIRATLYNPKSPEFSVTQIKAKNLNQILHHNMETLSTHPPVYEISLQAKNPNPRLSVSYYGPGEASLIFTNHRIGHGGFPSIVIREEPNVPVNIPVTLSGKDVPLSPAMKLSLMHRFAPVPVEVNSWLKNEFMDLNVTCDFRVNDSLMNHTKITFQECTTQF